MYGQLPFALTEDEWAHVFGALNNTRFKSLAQKLKDLKNLPQLPRDLFDEPCDRNQGEETVNTIFRNRGAPFHLKRIGDHGGSRTQRRLAIVRWHYAQQLRFDFDKNVRTYRSYKWGARYAS